MRLAFVLCLIFTLGVGQSETGLDQDEMSDPDEQNYINGILAALFYPLNLELADTMQLVSRGFSQSAIDILLQWQREGGNTKQFERLQKQLRSEDLKLLEGTLQSRQNQSSVLFRQRMQYSASLEGWRILHKGRIQNEIGSLVFLMEQDPGEKNLTDHSVFTLSSDRIPRVGSLLVGDFHITWGGGLLLNQQRGRSGLTPSSLQKNFKLALTPHYSTRETNYFHGVAAKWQNNLMQGVAFISNRWALGHYNQENFSEDSDGIHPAGKLYDSKSLDAVGMAGIIKFSKIQLYLASLQNGHLQQDLGVELGVQFELNPRHQFQVFVDSPNYYKAKSLANWRYKTRAFEFAVQHRYYRSLLVQSEGSVLALLGSNAESEKGLSVRLLVRPRKYIIMLYSLDVGTSAQLRSLSDTRQVIWHKAQFRYRIPQREWQLDLNVKDDGPQIPDDIWEDEIQHLQIAKFAVSLSEKLTPALRYRLNIKTAIQKEEQSILIQQRILINYHNSNAAIGYSRYSIPSYLLRLSTYESGLAESFNFFTAYDDGQHWFIYLKYVKNELIELEFRVAQMQGFQFPGLSKQLEYGFQLSVVL
ncbi:hypothetical protein HQ531_03615 [bacterium]|nr:hypothetical protein [bacterium]